MKDKKLWLDNLRVISTIAVIVLHVSAPILSQYKKVSIEIWHIGNLYDGSVRFCVPVFFMLSGTLLLSKDYKISVFLKTRFWRIIPPLVFWSIIYILYDYFFVDKETLSKIEFVKNIVKKLFFGSKYHLWFVYSLLGLYLFIPILRKWIKNASKKEIQYFLVIWITTIIYSLPYIKLYLPRIPLTNFTGYIGYLVLGYYLSNLKVKSKFIPIVFIIVGIIVTVYGTYYSTLKENEFSSNYYGYLTPNVILTAIGIFLLLKDVKLKNKWVRSIISFLSNHSFGIYLAHVIILTLLNIIGINWELTNPIISIPITSIICIVLSSLIIYLIRKVKYGNYISG